MSEARRVFDPPSQLHIFGTFSSAPRCTCERHCGVHILALQRHSHCDVIVMGALPVSTALSSNVGVCIGQEGGKGSTCLSPPPLPYSPCSPQGQVKPWRQVGWFAQASSLDAGASWADILDLEDQEQTFTSPGVTPPSMAGRVGGWVDPNTLGGLGGSWVESGSKVFWEKADGSVMARGNVPNVVNLWLGGPSQAGQCFV